MEQYDYSDNSRLKEQENSNEKLYGKNWRELFTKEAEQYKNKTFFEICEMLNPKQK